jgi:peptidoglycan/xylan/chitin deacetylase (PgdA/CDA1 family)
LAIDEVQAIAEAGMEIGSHSCTHPYLDQLDYISLRDEVHRSKRQLEDIIGRPITSFAYPFGRFNEVVVEEVKRAGYCLACTTQSGWCNPQESQFLVRRLTIFNQDSLNSFVRKMSLGDNAVGWTSIVNYGVRRACERIKTRCSKTRGQK